MTQKMAILGAGAVGCWAGGLWSDAAEIMLIGRPALVGSLGDADLTLESVSSKRLQVVCVPSALAGADAIVLAMKAHALEDAMDQIEEYAHPDVVLISLLNGVDPVRRLRSRFPERHVIAGMVPFNVVWTGPTTLRKSGAGDIALERHKVTAALPGVALHHDLLPIQYGKLLLNLVNAVNALAGLPLYEMLLARGYRRIYAASLEEALAVYKAAHIDWAQVGPTSPRVAIPMLRTPTWLFERLVLRRQALDRTSMTSMASDLINRRPTEIDTINGEIVRLGESVGVPTPVNGKISFLVREIENGRHPGRFDPDVLCQEVLQ